MSQHLHIVSFDIPFLPDYGGAALVFSQIKALAEAGIHIHLHCFEYGRQRQPELNKYCEEVIYYKRKTLSGISLSLPYIVSSRINKHLLENISRDNYPILLEGIHCTYFLYNGKFSGRKVIVQLHNVEHIYYSELAKTTSNIYKKSYYAAESILLKKYERQLAQSAQFIALNETDLAIYKNEMDAANVEFIPPIVPFDNVCSLRGKGQFCLYHGNLSVPENEKAAAWLIEEVFNRTNIPLIVAGKNPSAKLKMLVKKNVSVVENPSEERMQELIKNAHVHLLPSYNSTGIKMKLLNALFNGRFVVADDAAVDGTGLSALCVVATTANGFLKNINRLFEKDFTDTDIIYRKKLLDELFNNGKNVRRMINLLS